MHADVHKSDRESFCKTLLQLAANSKLIINNYYFSFVGSSSMYKCRSDVDYYELKKRALQLNC